MLSAVGSAVATFYSTRSTHAARNREATRSPSSSKASFMHWLVEADTIHFEAVGRLRLGVFLVGALHHPGTFFFFTIVFAAAFASSSLDGELGSTPSCCSAGAVGCGAERALA